MRKRAKGFGLKFKKWLYCLSLFLSESQESYSPEVQVQYEADFIQDQRMVEGDDDIEGFQPQSESQPTILEKILGRQKETYLRWTVVQNKKNELSKFEKILKRELSRKDCMSLEDSERVKNVWELKAEDRWQLYRRWIAAAKKEYHWQMATKQVEYEDAIEAFEEARSEEDSEVLRFASVIGMTTSGNML